MCFIFSLFVLVSCYPFPPSSALPYCINAQCLATFKRLYPDRLALSKVTNRQYPCLRDHEGIVWGDDGGYPVDDSTRRGFMHVNLRYDEFSFHSHDFLGGADALVGKLVFTCRSEDCDNMRSVQSRHQNQS
ncbi:hypothetical protein F5Y15DRAFT_35488 [Xylariaceae sp. FL0016]|nr:hypothetical protein F5Y15DRAFT_35488 [Xylariaceae sp. FL0016]